MGQGVPARDQFSAGVVEENHVGLGPGRKRLSGHAADCVVDERHRHHPDGALERIGRRRGLLYGLRTLGRLRPGDLAQLRARPSSKTVPFGGEQFHDLAELALGLGAHDVECIERVLEERSNDIGHRNTPCVGDPLELLLEDRGHAGVQHPLFPGVLAALLVVSLAHAPLVTRCDTIATGLVSQSCKRL